MCLVVIEFVVYYYPVRAFGLYSSSNNNYQDRIGRDSVYWFRIPTTCSAQKTFLFQTTEPRVLNFAISRSGGILGAVSVEYLVTYHDTDGTERTTSIGVQRSGTISFSPGQNSVSVSLNISKEGFIRANSSFRIHLNSLNLKQPGRFLSYSLVMHVYIILAFLTKA